MTAFSRGFVVRSLISSLLLKKNSLVNRRRLDGLSDPHIRLEEGGPGPVVRRRRVGPGCPSRVPVEDRGLPPSAVPSRTLRLGGVGGVTSMEGWSARTRSGEGLPESSPGAPGVVDTSGVSAQEDNLTVLGR